MEIEVINESGLEQAILGMQFSFKKECPISDIPIDFHDPEWYAQHEKGMIVAKRLCKKDLGHSKFLQCIQVWMIVRAPLYWWKQFDQYKIATTTLSKSTMHTLMKKKLDVSDFTGSYIYPKDMVELNKYIEAKEFDVVNALLPHSFLQTRMVNTNYKSLRNMLKQRKGHKLNEWKYFEEEVLRQLNTPELLGLE